MTKDLLACPHYCSVRPYSTPEREASAVRYLRRRRREQPVGPDGELILVAEDDRFLRTLVATVLCRSGYTVIEAFDGEDALVKFRNLRDRIDLLLLDMEMPKKNGKEVYDEIRQTNPGIKVMFASAYPSEMVRERGIVEGDAHFLAKPFGPQLLLKRVREVLDG